MLGAANPFSTNPRSFVVPCLPHSRPDSFPVRQCIGLNRASVRWALPWRESGYERIATNVNRQRSGSAAGACSRSDRRSPRTPQMAANPSFRLRRGMASGLLAAAFARLDRRQDDSVSRTCFRWIPRPETAAFGILACSAGEISPGCAAGCGYRRRPPSTRSIGHLPVAASSSADHAGARAVGGNRGAQRLSSRSDCASPAALRRLAAALRRR